MRNFLKDIQQGIRFRRLASARRPVAMLMKYQLRARIGKLVLIGREPGLDDAVSVALIKLAGTALGTAPSRIDSFVERVEKKSASLVDQLLIFA